MAQNYASAHLNVLDEKFSTESKTDLIINKGIRLEFEGKKSVTIYNVDTVGEVNYNRDGDATGGNRFGNLVELGTGTQTFTLSQDKAFTFTVDQGNLEDSMFAQEIGKSVKRQVKEVSVPNTDKYRLSTLAAYGIANSQATTLALTESNAYSEFLKHQAALDDLEVDADNRVTFLTPAVYNLFKLDPKFAKACDTSYADAKKGVIGMVDGNTLVKLPSSYFPATVGFITVHNAVLVAPTKFDMVRVLNDVQGVHGAVAEGRRYYDAFIPTNKGKAIRVHKLTA